MAGSSTAKKRFAAESYTIFPSRFGSHASMIDNEKTEVLNDPNLVVLKDEFGFYTTERNRLDTKMADPNRYESKRLGKLIHRSGSKEEETKNV
jgi:hypothetical protein